MELQLDLTKRYTFADYLTWIDDKFREVLNGVVSEMSPAPLMRHQRFSGRLYRSVTNFIFGKKGKCEVFYAPFDVRLPNKENETADNQIYTVVQPDICVICDPAKIDEKGCLGSPDLIVEILSPSTAQKDLHDKFYLYQEHGVREYWIVFPNEKLVTVYILEDEGKYNKGTTYTYEQTIGVHIFGEELQIDLREIFEN